MARSFAGKGNKFARSSRGKGTRLLVVLGGREYSLPFPPRNTNSLILVKISENGFIQNSLRDLETTDKQIRKDANGKAEHIILICRENLLK